MAIYQCPDCLGVHDKATEPVLGLFVRCEICLLARDLTHDAMLEAEQVQAEAA